MGSTALDIINYAYRDLNLDQVTSFSTTQEFPANIALDVLNEVIMEMNRMGNLYFTESATAITYVPGAYSYDLSAYSIDPRRIVMIRSALSGQQYKLTEYEHSQFLNLYRTGSTIGTQTPRYWTKYGTKVYLDSIPDKDYSLYVYHYADMPPVSLTTDTLLLPTNDEDVIKMNCYHYLGFKIGRWDYGTAIAAMRSKTASLLVAMKSDPGLPQQMPANF